MNELITTNESMNVPLLYPQRLSGDVLEVTLNAFAIAELDASIARLMHAGHISSDPNGFEASAFDIRDAAPRILRELFDTFRRTEPTGACIIRGYRVNDKAIGPTPSTWENAAAHENTQCEDRYISIVAMCLGDMFGWSTLQNGNLIHNVLPIRGDETEQSGHGSTALLEWHTEDGFHANRCDYLLLLGMRNDDQIPTTYGSIREVHLSSIHRELLFQPQYCLLPDDEHVRQVSTRFPKHPGVLNMQAMRTSPQPVSVLFGASNQPYLRIDPHFMRCAPSATAEHREALSALISALNQVQVDIVIEPGDLLIIDNFQAVHGRRGFQARFDGRDRWLKKTLVTRDIRRSRQYRESVVSSILL